MTETATDLEARLRGDVLRNPLIVAALRTLREEGVDGWVVGGAVCQTVWNLLGGHDPVRGLKDIDVFYHDASVLEHADQGEQAEQALEERLQARFRALSGSDMRLDARNQARVHLWYPDKFGEGRPYPPLVDAREGVARFLATGNMLGVRGDPDHAEALEIFAPAGLEDAYAFRLRLNPFFPSGPKESYEAKAARWQALWPRLQCDPWPEDRGAWMARGPAPNPVVERGVEDLPAPSETLRELAKDRLKAPYVHDYLMSGLACFNAVEVRRRAAPSRAPHPLRLAAWNLERCYHPEASAALLAEHGVDVALLTEVDLGCARTGNRHTVRELADHLQADYAYGVEFLELTHGTAEENERFAGQGSTHGFHGNAVVSRAGLGRAARARLFGDLAWYPEYLAHCRIGDRMAVLVQIPWGETVLTLASVHLESYGTRAGRAEQIRHVVAATERLAAGGPAVIAGDLNTTSLDHGQWRDPATVDRAFTDDPARLLDPRPHEPLFEVLTTAGFETGPAFAPGGTVRKPDKPQAEDLRLDWIAVRGVRAAKPAIVPALSPDGTALSDHECLIVELQPV